MGVLLDINIGDEYPNSFTDHWFCEAAKT